MSDVAFWMIGGGGSFVVALLGILTTRPVAVLSSIDSGLKKIFPSFFIAIEFHL